MTSQGRKRIDLQREANQETTQPRNDGHPEALNVHLLQTFSNNALGTGNDIIVADERRGTKQEQEHERDETKLQKDCVRVQIVSGSLQARVRVIYVGVGGGQLDDTVINSLHVPGALLR